MVQEPDFFGMARQDHHIIDGATPIASIARCGKIGMTLKAFNFVSSNTLDY